MNTAAFLGLAFLLLFPGIVPTAPAKDVLHVKTFLIDPWGMVAGEKRCGITYDMAMAVAREADLDIVNEIVPFARFLEALRTGESDIGIMHRTPESEALAEPLGRTMVDPEVVILPRKGLVIRTLDDLARLTVGVTRAGSGVQDDRISTNTTIRIVEYKTDRQGVEMLREGRLDSLLSSRETSSYLIKQLGFSPDDFGAPLTLSIKEGNVMFSRASRNQHLKERVRVAVEALQRKGVFLQIRKEYLGY